MEVWTRRGLQRFMVLFFIELSTRKVQIAGIATDSNGLWMSQIGRNLTDAVDGILKRKCYLIHDRDPLFTAEFLSMLADVGVKSTRDAALVPLTTALDVARLTSDACNQFREQEEAEQRKLLTMILKEATWKDGGLRTTLLEPFEQLRRSNQLSHTNDNGNGASGMDLKIWLPENAVFQLFLLRFLNDSADSR